MNSILEPRPSGQSVIHKTSSPSVTVFWLNQEQVRKNLQTAIEKLAREHPEIEEVWLFGSLARGEAMPGSDADLLMILGSSPVPFRDRFARYWPDFPGVDVFAYTRAELAQMQADGNSFARRALSEGVSLFMNKTEPIPQEGI